jgi:AraC-like DNA-binding protein
MQNLIQHMNQEIRLSSHVLAAVVSVREYIDQHPLQWKTTDELADQATINRKLLQKIFKLYYGVRVSEYQLQKRMEAAAQMLEEGRLSKKQIAAKCGYHMPNNFSSAFKKVYNMSPSDWQQEKLPAIPLNSLPTLNNVTGLVERKKVG